MKELGKSQKQNIIYILSTIAAGVFFFMLFGNTGYVLSDDSYTYIKELYTEGVAPLYPLFLRANLIVFGEEAYLQAVVAKQSVLAIFCVVVFCQAIRRRFELPLWAAYAVFLLSLFPFTLELPTAVLSHMILTEGITYSIFYLFALCALKAVFDKSYKWLMITYMVVYLLAMTRPQLELLFGVCGILFFYIVLCTNTQPSRRKGMGTAVRIIIAVVGCVVIALAGVILCVNSNQAYQICINRLGISRINPSVVQNFDSTDEQKRQSQAAPEEGSTQDNQNAQNTQDTQNNQNAQDTQENGQGNMATSQLVTLLFSRGMYEADYEDYLLFEEEEVREVFLVFFEKVDRKQYRYPYARKDLWMWQDITESVGKVGKACHNSQMKFYKEYNPEVFYDRTAYQNRSSYNYSVIGWTLLKAHFCRFLYHTIMLLPQAFICTVFFQIAPVYLLCHLVTLFLYVSALILMIWGFVDKRVPNRYAEFMAFVLSTNVVMVVLISTVFFGLQRYLLYTFGLFYIAYFLLLLQVWEQYGNNVLEILMRWKKKRRS